MEEEVEREKEAIRKQFEKKKQKIMAETEMDGEEKRRLVEDLAAKEDATHNTSVTGITR